jgi:hypothetical protein
MHHTYQKTLVPGIHFFTSKHWTFTSTMLKSPSIGSSPYECQVGQLAGEWYPRPCFIVPFHLT